MVTLCPAAAPAEPPLLEASTADVCVPGTLWSHRASGIRVRIPQLTRFFTGQVKYESFIQQTLHLLTCWGPCEALGQR